MKKNYVCISCPVGCRLELEDIDGDLTVTGNKCPRGEIYAREEYRSPKRTVTATCMIDSVQSVRLPVKTDKPVLKEHIKGLLDEIYGLRMVPPVKTGDVVIHNYNDTGINVISTKTVLK
jgi:CxxC motif-containing protein